jgi:hypothetical protein
MRAATLEVWVWVLIYGGLLAVGLGLALQRQGDAALGWTLVLVGGIVAAVGVVLIWVRSRMKDDKG